MYSFTCEGSIFFSLLSFASLWIFLYTVLRKFTSDFHRVNQTLTKRIFLHENAIIINRVLVRASIILFYSYYPFAL